MHYTHTSKTHHPPRLFGYFEVVFNFVYLALAFTLAIIILGKADSPVALLAGSSALLLATGDMFHLVPRIMAVLGGADSRLQNALGFGKLVTSITMTIFYILLWHIGSLLPGGNIGQRWTGIIYLLGFLRILICIAPQNKWYESPSPPDWSLYRNVPFVVMGSGVMIMYMAVGQIFPELCWMGFAIFLSFAFYMPVALWVDRNRKLGLLMLPKTCMYIWILWMLRTI
jgi:hypothetical protein